jgi:hypothetical protein
MRRQQFWLGLDLIRTVPKHMHRVRYKFQKCCRLSIEERTLRRACYPPSDHEGSTNDQAEQTYRQEQRGIGNKDDEPGKAISIDSLKDGPDRAKGATHNVVAGDNRVPQKPDAEAVRAMAVVQKTTVLFLILDPDY